MKFKTGLVVGKFCPLTKGHEYLVETALKACGQVVIISYANPAYMGCEADKRRHWLEALYPQTIRLVIDDEWLANNPSADWPEIPHDDASESIHRAFTAWACHQRLGATIDAVFTSEDYGDGFAASLSDYYSAKLGRPHRVQHISVDPARETIPVSGTKIRQAPHANREFLSEIVYGSFVKRILLLGGESTGKTTLCAAVADRLSTAWAPEYGREITEDKDGKLVFEDLLHIAEVQIDREEKLAGKSNRWLICDTSPLTTAFYSEAMFGRVDPELVKMADRPYDLTFLCKADFDFVQDGLRENADFRDWQQFWYRAELEHRGIDYTVLSGSLENRIDQMLAKMKA